MICDQAGTEAVYSAVLAKIRKGLLLVRATLRKGGAWAAAYSIAERVAQATRKRVEVQIDRKKTTGERMAFVFIVNPRRVKL